MGERTQPPWWAEATLVAVHLAVVAGFARLYDDASYAGALVAVVLGAHLGASVCRRIGLGSLGTVAVSIVGAVVVITWALLWSTTWWGLPTADTWEQSTAALDQARERFSVVIAPTPVLLGFQLASAVALWWAVWFADWTAHRLRATIEPIVPAAAIFVFCSVLGDGRDQVSTATWFAATALAFVATQRAVAAGPAATPAILRGAALVAVVAVAAGAVVGPRLPGAGEDPVIAWRERGDADPTRVTVSPMVELKRRLVEQSDVLAFEVRSSQPSYWRLTSLDSFDGEIWTSSGEYTEASGELDSSTTADALDEPVTQTFDISALATIWVPAAFEAQEVTQSEAPLRWDDESGTLIVESSAPTSDGLTYTVRSRTPTTDAATLGAADDASPSELTRRYTKLPSGFPEIAAQRADQVTAAARAVDGSLGRYEAALALQDWFRSEFTYDLNSPPGHGDDALVSFLEDRRGYCEQFAGAFAAMARSLGMPARVAVGFTPGDADPSDPERFRVRGRHAHAWPEVHFAGIGWVPFEPTPQRGIPGAEDYTGVAPQQATIDGATPTPTPETTATPTTAPAPEAEPTEPAASPEQTETRTAAAPGDESGPSLADGARRFGAVAVVAAAALALVWLVRRPRAERSTGGDASHADRAWTEVATALERRGLGTQRGSETPAEYAERVSGEIGDRADPLRRLADLVNQARWAATPLGATGEAEVDALAREVLA